MIIIKICIYLLQAYFLFYTGYLLFALVASLIFKIRYRPCKTESGHLQRFALMIPAYNANRQLKHVIDACFMQHYPRSHVDVFVLAQHCSAEIVTLAKDAGAVVFEKNFDNEQGNPYLRALNYFILAIEKFKHYDAIVLIDKDNLLDADFLPVVNCRLGQGYVAVQGRRRPLNLDTNAACLDYISETMNDQMLRAAKAALGLSAEISGSGMAFRFELYKQAIQSVDFQSPVHDKTFFIELIKMKTHIFYEPQAVVYEEKTQSYRAISQQRTRWLSGQLYLFKNNFWKLIAAGITQRRWEPVDYALTLLKAPRALHIMGLLFWTVFVLLFSNVSLGSWFFWGLCLLCYLAGIMAMLWIDRAPKKVYLALMSSPLFMISIVKSLWRSLTRNVKGKFIHTEHHAEISIKDVKKDKI